MPSTSAKVKGSCFAHHFQDNSGPNLREPPVASWVPMPSPKHYPVVHPTSLCQPAVGGKQVTILQSVRADDDNPFVLKRYSEHTTVACFRSLLHRAGTYIPLLEGFLVALPHKGEVVEQSFPNIVFLLGVGTRYVNEVYSTDRDHLENHAGESHGCIGSTHHLLAHVHRGILQISQYGWSEIGIMLKLNCVV